MPHNGRAGLAVQEAEKEQGEQQQGGEGGGTWGWGDDLQVQGGSGAGSHMAPAGNVMLSDVSGQAKYNLVSTWKDVL